ncbi:TonB-dependent receptor plug domain-containing protein [Hydrogenimonas cancrithermarum]|uniref:Vitamin B12 transporter BtuB n=1 Tax=Hydrogenimonas cancrithermarum TaxID=2993563 RepID=A0ABN6WU39_9BACT|nr:TonB-dependent receptor [Hydrogenimonas cancrithermarum]BDY12195.1 vitamin B12 transporter BtuB [Hydrogenimonas cancrithermarum]
MKFAKGFKGRYFSLAAIAATVSCVHLHAQNTQAIQLEKIIVSAANTEQEEDDVTEDVTVITADEIQERGYQTLKDALASVPGISFTSNGGFGQPTSLYLRGMNSNNTLVLIDGIRANDVTGLNGAQFEHYLLDNVERIEVIKGSQSGIWGADASAGVINIITKYPKKKTISFALKGGAYNTKQLSLAFGNKIGAFDFFFSLDHFDTDGFSAAEPGRSSPDYGKRGDDLGWEEDPYKNTTYSLKTGYDLSSHDRLEASATILNATVHFDAAGGVDAEDLDDPFGYGPTSYVNDIKNRYFNINYQRTDERNKARIFYNVSTFNRSQYGGYSGHTKEFGLSDRFDYTKDDFVQGGIGYQKFHQGDSAGIDLGKKYDNRYLFATNYNRFFDSETILSETVRYDNYSAFDNKLTYKIGLKQYISTDLYISGNYGTGYNAPSLYQLYSFYGNRNLKPEKSRGYDLSIGYKGIKICYFRQSVEDLIDFYYDYSTYTGYYFNADGTSKFEGIEANYSQGFFDLLSVNLGYTHLLKAEDNEGNDLYRRAKDSFSYALTWYPTDAHSIDINGYYVGERYDSAFNPVQTGKYNVTNVALRHNFAKGFTGEIEVRNLFDRFYQEVDGYGTAGRSIYVGISAKY